MQIVYSEQHAHQNPQLELSGGQLVPSFEAPSRAEAVLRRIQDVGFGEILSPVDFGLLSIQNVHDAAYLQFLQSAWQQWQAAGMQGEIIPLSWPVGSCSTPIPRHIKGQVGYYALGTDTNITAGSWKAAYGMAQAALTGADLLCQGVPSAFALGRPPGHHAATAHYGGYCFLNNAAIAAQYCLDQGLSKVVILDVDFHHGNGTQEIFYARDDVLFVSIHGDPVDHFPYYWGHVDEIGAQAGEGCNLNIPLPAGTDFVHWDKALQAAMKRIVDFDAQVLIVSLGVDTFEHDPLSTFSLQSSDYFTMGKTLAMLQLPTLFVMEGGYDVEALGVNMVNVLQGFEAAL